MTRSIDVFLDTKGHVFADVRGYGSRDMLIDVGAKPVFLPRKRVWTVSYKHGLDVIALAEHRGYFVTCNRPPPAPVKEPPTMGDSEPEDVGLW